MISEISQLEETQQLWPHSRHLSVCNQSQASTLSYSTSRHSHSCENELVSVESPLVGALPGSKSIPEPWDSAARSKEQAPRRTARGGVQTFLWKARPSASLFFQEEVMVLERILLQTIKFDLQVEHPYQFLLKYAKQLKGKNCCFALALCLHPSGPVFAVHAQLA